MVTDIQIDELLLSQAKNLAGFSSHSQTVNQALHEFIQVRLRQQLIDLQGTIEYDADYDYKTLRREKS